MDQHKIDELERLARLRADGALNEAEYAAAKTRLLERPDAQSFSAAPSASGHAPEQPIDETRLAPIWRQRFQFIDANGFSNDKRNAAALKSVPFLEQTRLIMSPLAFLFGPLYFLYLGLWRPALSLFGVSMAYAVVVGLLSLPPSINRVMWVVPSVAYAWTCIPLYYLRVRRGLHDWNPLIWWKA